MILSVRVVPKAKRNLVSQENGRLKVYLTKPAHENLANTQLKDILAEYLRVKRHQLRIIRGEKSRDKLIEVLDG